MARTMKNLNAVPYLDHVTVVQTQAGFQGGPSTALMG